MLEMHRDFEMKSIKNEHFWRYKQPSPYFVDFFFTSKISSKYKATDAIKCVRVLG